MRHRSQPPPGRSLVPKSRPHRQPLRHRRTRPSGTGQTAPTSPSSPAKRSQHRLCPGSTPTGTTLHHRRTHPAKPHSRRRQPALCSHARKRRSRLPHGHLLPGRVRSPAKRSTSPWLVTKRSRRRIYTRPRNPEKRPIASVPSKPSATQPETNRKKIQKKLDIPPSFLYPSLVPRLLQTDSDEFGNQRKKKIAGWSSQVARQAHNLKAAGSNPAPASKALSSRGRASFFPFPPSSPTCRNFTRRRSLLFSRRKLLQERDRTRSCFRLVRRTGTLVPVFNHGELLGDDRLEPCLLLA